MDFNLALESHDFKHDIHYLIKIRIPADIPQDYNNQMSYANHLFYEIERAKKEIMEMHRKEMVKKKFHLKCID